MTPVEAITEQLASDQHVVLELDSFAAFTVASALQLACRHPSVDGQLEEVLVDVVNSIAIGLGGPVATALAAGWDQERDV